jgi:pimeloyl-ACP methyl ester carboxylesterase
MSQVKAIVLVHGFWADASCYSQIIPPLLAKGYEVIAVQNPLTSLADDIAATKRALARIDGQCILVGHSWGGMVITEVGNDDRVAGLVYIAALAPDLGESMIDLISPYGSPSPHFQEQEGYVWISKEGVEQILANDLSAEQAALIYATQIAPSASLPTAKAGSPAWKTKPSWYLIANQDQAVPPDLQHHLSKRMGAATMMVEASHFAMMSHAEAVAGMIREAASLLEVSGQFATLSQPVNELQAIDSSLFRTT